LVLPFWYRLTRVVPDKGPLKRVCVNFVAAILKVLLVNLLAAVNFANVFLNKKRLENKKTLKTFFTCMGGWVGLVLQ